MASTCADTFRALCGTDFQGFVTEGRNDCPGRLWGSGIVRQSPEMQGLIASGFWEAKMSFWSLTSNTMGALDLTNLDAGVGIPNPGADCPPCTTERMKELMARKFMRTACWTADAFDATCNYTGRDAEDVIIERIGQWGVDMVERELLLQILGIYLENKANGGDLIFDANAASNANLISQPGYLYKDSVVCALAKMGCKMGDFMGMVSHTDVETSLFKRDLIMTDSGDCDDGNCITRNYFDGKDFYSTDLELKDPDTGQYITVLFKEGAFAYAEEDLGDMALGNDTEECGPNGLPVEEWIPRSCFALNPVGWSNCYDPSANTVVVNGETREMTNQAPSQLIDPANWCRGFDCKSVGVAFLVHAEDDAVVT